MSARYELRAPATDGSSLPETRRDDRRERLIDVALELFVHRGYDATTVEQIAADADLPLGDFGEFFADTEAVLMSVIEDISHATVVALQRIEKDADPEHALLRAVSAVVSAIVEGHGAVSLERLINLARVVSTTRNLHRRVAAERRRLIAPALAAWMGVDLRDRRLLRALTMWSAVTASAYVGAANLPEQYVPPPGGELQQRISAYLGHSFAQVLGDDPT